jgi:hypothetical protein
MVGASLNACSVLFIMFESAAGSDNESWTKDGRTQAIHIVFWLLSDNTRNNWTARIREPKVVGHLPFHFQMELKDCPHSSPRGSMYELLMKWLVITFYSSEYKFIYALYNILSQKTRVGSCIVTAICVITNPVQLYWTVTISTYFNMGLRDFLITLYIQACQQKYWQWQYRRNYVIRTECASCLQIQCW